MSTDNSENFKDSKDYIQSLDRGLQVLQAFSKDTPYLTVSEIAKATEISRPTVRRLLLTLEHLGYLSSNHNAFMLAPKVISLSNAYLATQHNTWEAALPYMEQFVHVTGESSSISVLDHDQVIYVARVSEKRIMSLSLEIGSHLPAVATSMGQVLLANLPDEQLHHFLAEATLEKYTEFTILKKEKLLQVLMEVREKGWAGVDQQFEIGLRSIAVPIHNQNGRVVAAINCSVHAGRVSRQQLREEFLPKLKSVAQEISKVISLY